MTDHSNPSARGMAFGGDEHEPSVARAHARADDLRGEPAEPHGRDATPVPDVVRALHAEFPDLPVGRILAVVVRALADLQRVATSRTLGASGDDVADVTISLARHRLRALRS